MTLTERLERLCGIYGVSGRESAVREYIISQLDEKCQYSVDPLGNLIVFKKGRLTANKKVMIAAHMDEVGFVVTYISDDGTLKIDSVGGIEAAVCAGKNVLVGDDLLPGVIGVKPIHLLKDDEGKKYPEKSSLYVDIGASSGEQASQLVSPGDFVCFDSDFVRFGCSLKGRAIDDRAGCAIMLEMLEGEPEYDTWFAFTVQEETGGGGAQTAAYAIEPDIAIVLEATTASDIPGVSGEKRVCLQGEGGVVSFMDRRTTYDKELFDRAFRIASENEIKIQTKTQVAGGNDAGVIFKTRRGVRVLALSLPCRYLHSASCVITESDLYETARLATLLAEDFSAK